MPAKKKVKQPEVVDNNIPTVEIDNPEPQNTNKVEVVVPPDSETDGPAVRTGPTVSIDTSDKAPGYIGDEDVVKGKTDTTQTKAEKETLGYKDTLLADQVAKLKRMGVKNDDITTAVIKSGFKRADTPRAIADALGSMLLLAMKAKSSISEITGTDRVSLPAASRNRKVVDAEMASIPKFKCSECGAINYVKIKANGQYDCYTCGAVYDDVSDLVIVNKTENK